METSVLIGNVWIRSGTGEGGGREGGIEHVGCGLCVLKGERNGGWNVGRNLEKHC